MSNPRRLRTPFSEFVSIHLATDECTWLCVGEEGEHKTFCEYTLSIHEAGDDEYPDDILALDIFLADASGDEWRARKLLHPDALWGHLNLESTSVQFFYDMEDEDPARFVGDANRDAAFAEALHLGGVRHSHDDAWISKRVGPGFQNISFDFEMTGTFDLAVNLYSRRTGERNESRFTVRLSGCMPYTVFTPEEEDPESRYEHDMDGEERDGMAPVQFEIGFMDLLRADDAVYLGEDEEQWEPIQIPLPLVFRRTGETGEPQAGVTVVETYGA